MSDLKIFVNGIDEEIPIDIVSYMPAHQAVIHLAPEYCEPADDGLLEWEVPDNPLATALLMENYAKEVVESILDEKENQRKEAATERAIERYEDRLLQECYP